LTQSEMNALCWKSDHYKGHNYQKPTDGSVGIQNYSYHHRWWRKGKEDHNPGVVMMVLPAGCLYL